jgi:Ion channel
MNMNHIAVTAIASVCMFFIVTGIFYECLCMVSRTVARASAKPRVFMVIMITGIFIAHILAITIYALAYWFLVGYVGITALAGNIQDYYLLYFYFSATTYTSLGVGDIYPVGGLRILTSIEALNGLILITWSAAFTYFGVQRMWDSHEIEKIASSNYEKGE